MCCTRLAENTGRKKVAKNRHLGTIAQLCQAISLQLRHVSTIGKNLLSSNMSSRCPHNMVNFGPLTAEIGSGVWGTPANFNGFRVLTALLHGNRTAGVSQTLQRGTRNGIIELSQTAPPVFDRAVIRLGIGPHSSCGILFWSIAMSTIECLLSRGCLLAHTCDRYSLILGPTQWLLGMCGRVFLGAISSQYS